MRILLVNSNRHVDPFRRELARALAEGKPARQLEAGEGATRKVA